MRWSRYYLFTTREAPKDAEVVSHRLMVRGSMIRKVAAGIYSYLPLGWRSVRKLEEIVRREMTRAGSVELSMPAIHPAELWQETDRWDVYGHLLLRMKDRNDRDFCFGPTHEEVITDIVRRDVRSYRQLPLSLFQIQTKFRDEIRPRFGLMRGREFIMKDAYTFHADQESLDETYEAIRAAYCRIFEACGLEYSMVEADSGTIGGASSHEFMVLADTGEDAVVRSPSGSYAANVERARIGPLETPAAAAAEELRRVETPGQRTVEDVARFLGKPLTALVKTLIYETEKELVGVVVRGDREVNEVKLRNHLGAKHLALGGEAKVREATGAPVGFAGPVALPGELRFVGDESARPLVNFVCGANAADAHFVGANWGRDATVEEWTDLVLARDGDPSPDGDGALELFRGIEVGHIFDLGTKYSAAMQCVFADENGEDRPMLMGCYGLGIGRTVAAAVEQNHDADGIIWPMALAPFEALVVSLDPDDAAVAGVADSIYEGLLEAGVDVFHDDRRERPGVKFKDADLIGFPVRVVVGARGLAEGKVEVSLRRDRERQLVDPGDAVALMRRLLEER
ncbi:MAG: proline--tRNA ligase [Acidobacteriota bacterium]|nr:proline--tRNA ligase [Acidobacteriota bacterium]